ncbi:MAG: methyltransferase domain-containing protein [Caldilineaceae bacterium]
MDRQTQSIIAYPGTLVKSLEVVWGAGFLSPGGPAEVREMLIGLDLTDRSVLDIGCGIGGVDLLLAQEHGAAQVIGIDLQPALLAIATARAAAVDLSDRVTFQFVSHGQLPFADQTFDLVFSKDALLHTADKLTYFADVLRVLKPGGWFVGSDGLKGTQPGEAARLAYQVALGLPVYWESLTSYGTLLQQVGFTEIQLRDRSAWFQEAVRQDNARIFGPLKPALIALVGTEAYAAWVKTRQAMQNAVTAGELTTGHFRARKSHHSAQKPQG